MKDRQNGSIVCPLIRSYLQTLKLSVWNAAGSGLTKRDGSVRRAIFVHSERDDLALLGMVQFSPFIVLATESVTGSCAARVLTALGCHVVRGSSSGSGSRALRELIRCFRSSRLPGAICVDGPLGPLGRAKPGIILAASKSGRPLIPVATSSRPQVVLSPLWSKMHFPTPFARVKVVFEKPLLVPEQVSRPEIISLAEALSRNLQGARVRARSMIRDYSN